MKITRRDLKVILLLIGILSAFLVYQFYFTGKLDDISAEETKQKNLESEISDLENKKSQEPAMNRKMQEFESNIAQVLSKYPVLDLYEDELLYLYNLEHTYDVYFKKYTLVESREISKVSGKINNTQHDISLLGASTSAEFVSTYEDVKKVLTNIYNTENTVRSVTRVKMTFNRKSGELAGELVFADFALMDGKREYESIKVPEFDEVYESDFVPSTDPDTGKYDGIIGVDNIFGDIIEETTEASSEEATR